MKKLNFKQSRDFMSFISILLDLGVVDIGTFMLISVKIADISYITNDDYLNMIFSSFEEEIS
jgi:hypothetical protein